MNNVSEAAAAGVEAYFDDNLFYKESEEREIFWKAGREQNFLATMLSSKSKKNKLGTTMKERNARVLRLVKRD